MAPFADELPRASYGELLSNIAALNKVSNVTFDGGFSKVSGQSGIQAREKLIQKLGWQMIDGDSPKPVPSNARPVEIQQQPEAANDF